MKNSIIISILICLFFTGAFSQEDPIVKAPTGVAVDSKDNIYLTSGNEIQVYSPERKFVKRIDWINYIGHIPSDTKIVIDNNDQILATNGEAIYRTDDKGVFAPVVTLASKPGDENRFLGFTTDSMNNILVANTKKGQVYIYSPKGELLGAFEKKTIARKTKVKEGDKEVEKEIQIEIGEPRDVFVHDGHVYVAHRDGVTIWKYDAEKAKAEFENFIENKWECTSCVVDSKGRLYATTTSSSFWCYEINTNVYEKKGEKWERVSWYNGDPYRFLKNPQDLAINSKDDIIIADTGNNRILIENAETFKGPQNDYTTWKETFDAEMPKITDVTRTSVKISWKTNEKMKSGIYFYPKISRKSQYVATKEGTEHSVILDRLEPGTRYEFTLAPFGRNIPYFTGSRYYSFVTKAPEGKKAYIKLPVLAVVFKNIVIFPEGTEKPKDIPQTPDTEISRIQEQLKTAELFYWVNSGLRFYPEIQILFIDDFYYEAPLGDYFYPNEEGHKKIREMFMEKGIDVASYGGVVVLNCIRHYNPKTGEYTYDRGTGGGTIGTYPPIEGFCSWRGFSNNTWLFVHEFGHSIDIKFQRSGLAEYPINHFMIDGDYGTHFNGIAFQQRMWGDRWWRMNYGELVLADDKDNDGIPDDEPNVPLDEKRFNSDPAKIDTDDDGLDDYDEIMASIWVWEGENDRTADGYFKPDPRNKDTDGDGIEDGKDKYPLYPYPTEIQHTKSLNDFDKPLLPFAVIKDREINATINPTWDDRYLYFALKTDKPCNIRIDLDPKNNGTMAEWSMDDYSITLKKDSEKVTGKAGQDDISKIEVTWNKDGEWFVTKISIPKSEKNGLTLKKGDTIGFLIYFRPEGYTGLEITPFEPNELFDFTLVE